MSLINHSGGDEQSRGFNTKIKDESSNVIAPVKTMTLREYADSSFHTPSLINDAYG